MTFQMIWGIKFVSSLPLLAAVNLSTGFSCAHFVSIFRYLVCVIVDSDSEKAMESWKRYLRRDDSKIVDLFVGQLKSTLQCTVCGHCSVTFDPFWDLSLPIPPSSKSNVKLQHCLDLFGKEEILDGDEKPVRNRDMRKDIRFTFTDISIVVWTRVGILTFLFFFFSHYLCRRVPNVKLGASAPKSLLFTSSLRFLCSVSCASFRRPCQTILNSFFIQWPSTDLKRFSPGERFRKLDASVDFPLTELDMSAYTSPGIKPSPCSYQLYGVINHSGSAYSGHYTASCRHPFSANWHEYNDSRFIHQFCLHFKITKNIYKFQLKINLK